MRDQLPLTRDLAHFAAFVFATTPRPVAEAIDTHRRGLDENPDGYLEVERRRTSTRPCARRAAEYLGGAPDDFALTDSTTMGLGVVYGGLRLAPGDEVLTTEHDFYATHEALRLAAARSGAERAARGALRRPRRPRPSTRSSAGSSTGVTDATRVVAVTWTHSSTGVKLPIRAIADALDDRGGDRPLLCVDAVHALGVEVESLPDLGCDVLVGRHPQVAVRTARHRHRVGQRAPGGRAIDPVIPPFEGASFQGWIDGVAPERTPGRRCRSRPGGYHTFEHRWALAEAFALPPRHRQAGGPRPHRRAGHAAQGGAGGRSWPRRSSPRPPRSSRAASCASRTEEEPFSLIEPLLEQGFTASVTPYRDRYLRLGPSIATTPDEVDAVVAALARARAIYAGWLWSSTRLPGRVVQERLAAGADR